MKSKNPFLAFLLAFFPGAGLLYLGKIRGLFYTLVVFGFLIFSFIMMIFIYNDFFSIVSILGAILFYVINFIDTVLTVSKRFKHEADEKEHATVSLERIESERFFTIILSFVPGLGHFQLGLVNRGMTILISFIGFIVMVVFITAFSGRSEFILFLAFSIIIWVYSFFDAMSQLTKKQNGEPLIDRSILEDFETRKEDGRKSKTIATLLSIFPGAGHLYIGLPKRGIQLMAAFLFSIYILDVLRLGIFLFLVPIIWFYSFFDGLQKASAFEKEELQDEPIISYLMNYQKWIGIGLIVLGFYYLTVNIFIPIAIPIVEQYFDLEYVFHRYFQTGVVCFILIVGGIKLLAGNKRRKETK